MEEILSERKKKILSEAEEMGAQQVLVTFPENIFYFTGFWGGGYCLISPDQCRLFIGALETFRALDHSLNTKVISAPVGTDALSLIKDFVEKGAKILTDEIKFSSKNIIEKKMEVFLTVSTTPFYKLRRKKDDIEIKAIEKASKKMDLLYEETLKVIKDGVSERKIASIVIGKAVEIGLDLPMFNSGFEPLIIASGPNSAYPHAPITERKMRRGDVITADYFFRYQGYISDITRTFVLGKAAEQVKEVYQIVKLAQEECIKQVRENAITGDLDNISRKIIRQSRFSDYFTHGTGHGVGLEVHEPPTLTIGQTDKLIHGDVVTVEPGVYLPSKFGVRIEDTVLVGEKAKILTKFNKELIEI